MRIMHLLPVLVCSSFSIPPSQLIAQHAPSDTVSSQVVNLEKLTWELAKKRDRGSLGKLLAEDYTEIIDDGVFDKAHLLAYLKDVTLLRYSLTGFKVKKLAGNAVLLVYQVSEAGEYKGSGFQADNNVASLWMKRGGIWQNVLFQETALRTNLPKRGRRHRPAGAASTAPTGIPIQWHSRRGLLRGELRAPPACASHNPKASLTCM
jgi:hypothetical protein